MFFYTVTELSLCLGKMKVNKGGKQMEILRVEHLKKQYGKGENTVMAVNDISFFSRKKENLLRLWEVLEAENRPFFIY